MEREHGMYAVTDCHEAHQLYQYGQTVELGPSNSQDDFSTSAMFSNSQDNCENYT